MSDRFPPLLMLLGVLLLVGYLSLFRVDERELAIRTQLGALVDSEYAPGLHAKWPFIDTIVRFQRRIIGQNYSGETFLDKENRGLIVDFYVKWRVKDAGRYFVATNGNETAASQRLADIVKDGIKNAVAQRTLQQIVAAERAAFTGAMFDRASRSLSDLGIELIDVRVTRIDLPEDVAQRVYASMQQEFERIAKQLRGEGEKSSLSIRAEADRKRVEILAAANRDALLIRGEGDAIATQTYARAFNRNPEFYAFYRSLQAYKNSLGKEGDVLVITPDSEFFRYLKSPGGGR